MVVHAQPPCAQPPIEDPETPTVDGILLGCESDCDCPDTGYYRCLCAAMAVPR
jgi:hypothetical protein